MPLHTDYRPDSFQEFVGSESVVKGLSKKLKTDRTPHVFLITGESGCGKTTLARIIAKSLGAWMEGEDPTRSLNYFEMDAADFRGIDSIRAIRKNLMLAPIGGAPCRLWLLDECHQLTKDAQEALLKALEEASGHVYFILATTEPEKLKDTLKRRCSHSHLERISEDDMSGYLKEIADLEESQVPDQAIDRIVDETQGSLGKGLAALEQIIDLPPKQMMQALHFEDDLHRQSIELCRALIKKSKWISVAKILSGLGKENPESVRRAVLGYCTSILLKKDDPRAYLVMDAFRSPFFDTPRESLVLAAYESLYSV